MSTATTGRSRAVATWATGVLLALIVIGVLAWFSPAADSDVPYAPTNAEEDGGRAVAQILGEQGVNVTFVRTTSAALADARPQGTVLIVNPHELRPEQQQAMARVEADVVLAGLGRNVEPLTEQVTYDPAGSRQVHPARCEEKHARAAGQIDAPGPMLRAEDPAVQLCFGEDAETGRYASWVQDGHIWRALSTPEVLTNALLAQEGNAALVLRALGQHEHLTWYLPDPDDTFGLTDADPAELTMPLLRPPVVALFVVLALALMFWRGRRLGPVINEPLPVVVRATETTRGRGRLYRRHRSHAHAGAALRAGSVARLAPALGLRRWSGRAEVVDAIAAATGRHAAQIDSALYGPPPHDDASLAALAQALQMMESEVHRP